MKWGSIIRERVPVIEVLGRSISEKEKAALAAANQGRRILADPLEEAQFIIEQWRKEYNQIRPHRSWGTGPQHRRQ